MIDDAHALGRWEELIELAREAATHAYVPYSHYRVGAAAIDTNGETYVGCNVENASYGITLCAECGLVSQLQLRDGAKLRQFVCTGPKDEVIVPCGRCRQLLREHAAPDFVALTPSGPKTMDELLPESFGPEWLEGKN